MVFYSWTSNWGDEYHKSARISLPDPLSTTVAAEYDRNPNGTNAVDYPEVLLMKVLATSLFQKAPEAYWMMRRLSVGDSELRELLSSSKLTSRQQIEESACGFVRRHLDLVQQVAPNCMTQILEGNADNAFDRATGTCTNAAAGSFHCFDTVYDNQKVDQVDHSKTVIRFGQRDWLSHDLMREITQILIAEKLGYTVRSEDIAHEPSAVAWVRFLEYS